MAASFHRERLINQYVFHVAPAFSGGNDGLGVFEGAGVATMADLWRGRIASTQQLGDDIEIVIEPNTQITESEISKEQERINESIKR
ncbi:hypothetical protein EMGBS4_03370 [Acidimicrobiaceae bacterium]|nr:hypothetical protein EMGBS4_03370 [Acidimicrobiaceae bacterium]